VLDTTIHKTRLVSCVLCMVVSNTYCAVFYVLFVFVLCLVHSGIHHILCCVFCFANKTKNTAQYVLDTTMHKTQDEDKQNIKHSTICVGYHYSQDTRHKTKTSNTKNTAQYVLDTQQLPKFILLRVCLRIVVYNTYCAVFFVLIVFVLCLVYSGVQHILCCVLCFVGLRLVSCE
jgi:phosphotransferase system  glucose/maltose/N-acetylglucosamine-specific IIC component